MKQELLIEPEYRTFRDPARGGMQVRLGDPLPCTFRADLPHPVPMVNSRRLARFRRNIEGGIRFQVKGGASIHFVTLAMRYDRSTGRLKGDLRYSTQRFIQMLRRTGLAVEYLRVIESTAAGVKNHAHLVLAVKGGDLPSEHALKDMWARSTYGSSFEVKRIRANADVGWLTRYLSKALGKYLSKQSFPEGSQASEASSTPGGLDWKGCANATARSYVTTSREWLPEGAERKWVRLFLECAVIWACTRGYWHTDLRDTGVRWLNWVVNQPHGQRRLSKSEGGHLREHFSTACSRDAAGVSPIYPRARAPASTAETARASGSPVVLDVKERSEDVKKSMVGEVKLANDTV